MRIQKEVKELSLNSILKRSEADPNFLSGVPKIKFSTNVLDKIRELDMDMLPDEPPVNGKHNGEKGKSPKDIKGFGGVSITESIIV